MIGDIEFWKSIILAFGYLGLFVIVFSECGLMIGFFLPGDSLLFTAGFLASQGAFNIVWLAIICFVATVLGNFVGYWFGCKFGPKLFNKENSLLFHKNHIERTRLFYEKHGPKTIILARFLPIIRTFAPILAGVGEMQFSTFFLYNIIGGAIWGIGVPLLGYFLGRLIPNVDRYLLPIILFIIIVSFLPPLLHFVQEYRKKRVQSSTRAITGANTRVKIKVSVETRAQSEASVRPETETASS